MGEGRVNHSSMRASDTPSMSHQSRSLSIGNPQQVLIRCFAVVSVSRSGLPIGVSVCCDVSAHHHALRYARQPIATVAASVRHTQDGVADGEPTRRYPASPPFSGLHGSGMIDTMASLGASAPLPRVILVAGILSVCIHLRGVVVTCRNEMPSSCATNRYHNRNSRKSDYKLTVRSS